MWKHSGGFCAELDEVVERYDTTFAIGCTANAAPHTRVSFAPTTLEEPLPFNTQGGLGGGRVAHFGGEMRGERRTH